METICEPHFVSFSHWPERTQSVNKRILIVDSILYDRLILSPPEGYIFYQNYPKLAGNSLRVIVHKEAKDVLGQIDRDLNTGFDVAAVEKLTPIDMWATYYALGGLTTYRLLTEILGEENPIVILEKVKEFYEKNSVKTISSPVSSEECRPIVSIDTKLGHPVLEYLKREFLAKGERTSAELSGSAQCVGDLITSRSFSSCGYAYVPGHHSMILSSYCKTFLKLDEELRKVGELSQAFKQYSAQESLRYLLGKKAGELNELLGFAPLNPLELVSKEVSNEQLDVTILKIRKDCGKVRKLFEKVHVNCLEKEIDKAIEAKMKLEDMNSNQSINYSILDNTKEIVNKKLQDAIHGFLDDMVRAETRSNVARTHRSLKKIKTRLGLISEVKFLTFGTLLILASCGKDTSYISEVFKDLGSTSLGLGAVGVAMRALEEGMKVYPGFNIYASFIKWPRIG